MCLPCNWMPSSSAGLKTPFSIVLAKSCLSGNSTDRLRTLFEIVYCVALNSSLVLVNLDEKHLQTLCKLTLILQLITKESMQERNTLLQLFQNCILFASLVQSALYEVFLEAT